MNANDQGWEGGRDFNWDEEDDGRVYCHCCMNRLMEGDAVPAVDGPAGSLHCRECADEWRDETVAIARESMAALVLGGQS